MANLAQFSVRAPGLCMVNSRPHIKQKDQAAMATWRTHGKFSPSHRAPPLSMHSVPVIYEKTIGGGGDAYPPHWWWNAWVLIDSGLYIKGAKRERLQQGMRVLIPRQLICCGTCVCQSAQRCSMQRRDPRPMLKVFHVMVTGKSNMREQS